ncbi:MAG: iron ABC transporter substrate-binding protein, partial [Spirochaetes bacterium]
IPIREDVSPPAGTPELDKIKFLKVDWKWLRANYAEIIRRFNQIFQR